MRISTRQRLLIVLLGTLTLVMMSLWTVRQAKRETRTAREVVEQITRKNADLVQSVDIQRFSRYSDPERDTLSDEELRDQLSGQLKRVTPVYDLKIGEQLTDRLIDSVTQFVYQRFMRDDLDSYINWRLRSGYRFRDRELMLVTWMVASDYESIVGAPFPEAIPLRLAMERIVEATTREKSVSESKLIGVSDSPEALFVRIRHHGLGSENPTDGFMTTEQEQLWTGPGMGSHRCWFTRTDPDAAEPEKFIEGQVGMVFLDASGNRKQVWVSAFLDHPDAEWSIEYLWTREYGGKGILIEF